MPPPIWADEEGQFQDEHSPPLDARLLRAATTMYREMDLRFWLKKVETEITARGRHL
jgi:hypothetical protein